MQEFDLSHYWMLGVMLIMGLFLGAAVLGHVLKKRRDKCQ